MRAGPFYVCNLGFGKDDERRTCLLTNKLFYTKLIDEANDSVLFIKVQKKDIFDASSKDGHQGEQLSRQC